MRSWISVLASSPNRQKSVAARSPGVTGSAAGKAADTVAAAMNRAALHAATCQYDTEAIGPMVPAGVGIYFGRAAKFRQDDHQGGIQNAPVRKIFDQAEKA